MTSHPHRIDRPWAGVLFVLLIAGGCTVGHREGNAAAPEPTPTATGETASAPVASVALEVVPGRTPGSLAIAGPRRVAPRSEWWALVGNERQTPPDIAMGDEAVIRRIILEGKFNNHVMTHLEHLSVRIGPRLTGSSRQEEFARWARDQFASWGLDAWLHEWGDIGVRFDRGPSTGRVFLGRPARGEGGMTYTEYDPVRDLVLTTLSWAPGTDGPTRGHVVREPVTEEEWEAVKDKLQGAWVLMRPAPIQGQRGVRNLTAERTRQRAEARKRQAEDPKPFESLPIRERLLFSGVHGYIAVSRDLRDRVWTGAVPGWRDLTLDTLHRDVEVIIRQSDYDFINSRLADNEPIQVEFDLRHTFSAGPDGGRVPVYNVIADLKGYEKPDEYVIVSAHMDSWDGPGSMGTTDNGTGTAVTLEAARILAAAGVRPRRTIRFILWSGEEQGLLGSRAYVNQFRETLAKTSAMFNDDGGTNYQGGIPCTDEMVPIFAAATAPSTTAFPEMPVRVRSTGERIRATGSSDHASFLAVGVPGFYWDEVGRADYGWGWHTQHDRIDLAIPEYLIQSSTNSAIVAYNIASMEGLLPRPAPPSEADQPTGRPRGGEGVGSRTPPPVRVGEPGSLDRD